MIDRHHSTNSQAWYDLRRSSYRLKTSLLTGQKLFKPDRCHLATRDEHHLKEIVNLLGEFPRPAWALSGKSSHKFFREELKSVIILQHLKTPLTDFHTLQEIVDANVYVTSSGSLLSHEIIVFIRLVHISVLLALVSV